MFAALRIEHLGFIGEKGTKMKGTQVGLLLNHGAKDSDDFVCSSMMCPSWILLCRFWILWAPNRRVAEMTIELNFR